MKTRAFVLATAILTGALAGFSAVPASLNDAPMGWASQNGGTTGGKGGQEITVTTMAELQKYAKTSGKYVIWVKGTMGSYGTRGNGDGDRVTLTSDKSILGLPGAHVKGGFDLSGVKNVILRNLTIEGPGACDNDCGTAGENRQDNITIVNGTTNVWLDHLEILDGEDGNTDITKKSDFITVSNVKFRYTDKSYPSGTSGKSHRFCNLLGGSDNPDKEGADNLSVTFYRTWWGEGVAERQPRVRFGKVHVANCLFDSKDPGQTHNIRAGFKANLLIENNAFIGQKKPIDLYNNDFTAVTARNNLFTSTSGNTAGSGTSFTPPYTLSLADASTIQALVSDTAKGAGANLVWGTVGIDESSRAGLASVRIVRQGSSVRVFNGEANDVMVVVHGLSGRMIGGRTTLVPGQDMVLPESRAIQFLEIQAPGMLRQERIVP